MLLIPSTKLFKKILNQELVLTYARLWNEQNKFSSMRHVASRHGQ